MNIARRVILFLGALATGAGIWLGAVTPTIFTLAAIIITPAPILFTWALVRPALVGPARVRYYQIASTVIALGCIGWESVRPLSEIRIHRRCHAAMERARADFPCDRVGMCFFHAGISLFDVDGCGERGEYACTPKGRPEWLHGYDCEVNIPPHPMRWSP